MYAKRLLEAKQLDSIEKKLIQHKALTTNDLFFLYEVHKSIEGLTYLKDSRIARFLRGRNREKDMSTMFHCTPKQIAHNQAEVTPQTKAYVGKLYPGIFTQLGHLEHLYLEFPKRKIWQNTITANTSNTSLKRLLQNYDLSAVGVEHKKHAAAAEHLVTLAAKNYKTVELKLEDMGFRTPPTFAQIIDKAKTFGLTFCPLQIGIAHWAKRKQGYLNTNLYIAMEPIKIGRKFCFFSMSYTGAFLPNMFNVEDQIYRGYTFIFCLEKKISFNYINR